MNDWVIANLESALTSWNARLQEIWTLLTMSPEQFRGGTIWNVIVRIYGTVQSVALGLLVLFFVAGLLQTACRYTELRRPEAVGRLFLRFLLAKGLVCRGMEILRKILSVCLGLINSLMEASGIAQPAAQVLPESIAESIRECGFWESVPLWTVSLVAIVGITVLSLILILTVYGRFFKIYLYAALAPLPLASFAGEPTQFLGVAFLKSFFGVCLEGAVIVLACVLFSAFAASPTQVDAAASAVTQVWSYAAQIGFSMLLLIGTVRAADQVTRSLFGLL